MVTTLACQRCKLTKLQQRWQWQHCNITVHASVTAVSTDSAVTAMFIFVWQRCSYSCDSDVHITVKVVATDSAVTALSVAIDVTLKSTSLSQHFLYNCCPSAVTVSAVTLLLAPSLSQRCACFHCHNAVLVSAATTLCSFPLPQRCARLRCHNAVLVSTATTLCSFPLPHCDAVLVYAVTMLYTLVSNRYGNPPVYQQKWLVRQNNR